MAPFAATQAAMQLWLVRLLNHRSQSPPAPAQSIAAAFGGPAAGSLAPDMPVLPVVEGGQGMAWLPGAAGTGPSPVAFAGFDLMLPPGAEVGPLLKSMGLLAVGRTVERYWEDEGAWGACWWQPWGLRQWRRPSPWLLLSPAPPSRAAQQAGGGPPPSRRTTHTAGSTS